MTALVVGGGIAGLSAALTLARAGLSVTVLEQSERFGGKVHTLSHEGHLLETGPDSFVSYKPAARALAVELGLADDLISPSEPRLVHLRRSGPGGGQMVPLPQAMGVVLPTRLGPFVRTRLFTPAQKLRAGLDVVLPRTLTSQDVSVGSFLTRRLGRAVVDQLADPLFGGIYGSSVDDLSLDAVLPMLRAQESEHRSLVLASLRQGRAATRSGGSPFLSLRHGMGSLVNVLVAELERLGVDLRPSTTVRRLSRTGSHTTAVLADGSQVSAEHVVFATPAPVTARLVADEVPAAATCLEEIPHVSTAVVHLGIPLESFREAPTGHGFLEAGPDRAVFSGCTYSSLKWSVAEESGSEESGTERSGAGEGARAPAGQVLVRVFLPQRSAALTHRPDAEVFAAVEQQLGAIIGGTPTMRHLTRWREAMPVYTVGHLDRLARLDAAIATRTGWALAGASYRGVGVPDCIASGTRAAESVLGVPRQPLGVPLVEA